MTPVIRLRPEAEEDLRQAYAWYEEQRIGLGDDFLLCIEAAIATITENPKAFPAIHREVRRILIRRFPYGIFYVCNEDVVTVLGIFHCRRNPRAWKSRRQ